MHFLTPLPIYHSQVGVDEYLDKHVFGGSRNGVFIDIGSPVGQTINNTFFLEKERGWSGIFLDTLPSLHKSSKKKNEKNRHGHKIVSLKGNTNKLSKLLDKHQLKRVDLCTIQTEEAALDILKSMDLSHYSIDCFIVEDKPSSKLTLLMKKNDYRLLKSFKHAGLYIKNDFSPRAWQRGILGAFRRDFSF